VILRIASSVIFFAILLFGLFSGVRFAHHIILAIVVGATLLGTHEYYNLARRLKIRPSPWPGHAIALAFLIDAYYFEFHHFVHIFITCFWVLLFTQVLLKSFDHAVANTATSLFGSIYVGLPMAIVLYISKYGETWGYANPNAGSYLIVFLVVTTWATDIGGYLIGKPFGRHKITPVMSPNKSLEGLIGGAALSVLAGVLLKACWPEMRVMFSWSEAAGLPLLFSILGVVGDLAESCFKRDACAKDSGRTYTGHGGMLDIIDSMLLCAPIFFLYLEITKA